MYHISNGGFRFRFESNEKEPFQRYDLSQDSRIINEQFLKNKDFSIHTARESFSIISGFGQDTAEITYEPFEIRIKRSDQLILTINKNNFLNFHKHGKASTPETYDGFVDPVKNGQTSVSCDFEFPEFVFVSGFGSRPKEMNLKDSIFRLYNFGGFANYGTVPYFICHSPTISASIFWMNPTDTFVSIEKTPNEDFELNKENQFKDKQRKIKFLSESGFIDFIINIGNFNYLIQSYTDLTGKPTMPPLFAFGYHQSHWGYKNQEDVENVIEKLNKANIPFDVFWLDIDHLEDNSPFTVNKNNFHDLNGLIQKLKMSNRFLVRITDPHISTHHEFAKEGIKNNYFILQGSSNQTDMTPFVGVCWPGKSYWPDFLNTKVIDWWSKKFNLMNFPENVFIWNDMNEPSVFHSIDGSFPKNSMHGIEYEDREVHNIYGLLNTVGTYKGLLNRVPNQRPFILSRSHFSGSQKFVWLWSGDNCASWKDLEESLCHMINFGISGFPFVGSDIGGFAGDPSRRLLLRWFQAASWIYPFFREHSHIDSAPREPYLYDENIQNSIRNRYKLLPLFYTAARTACLTGIPIVKPIWADFPDLPLFHSIQNQLLVADTLLVCPVVSEKSDLNKEMEINIPFEYWYDFYSGEKYICGKIKKKLTDENIPVFVRGGKIFLTYSAIGSNVNETIRKPMTLYAALDQNNKASGEAYFDDGYSFNFTNGEYFHKRFSFSNGILKMRTHQHLRESFPNYVHDLFINKIVIFGTPDLSKKIKLDFKGILHKMPNNMIVIEKVNLSLLGDFTLFDGVNDSGLKIRNIVFKSVVIFLVISAFLPLISHFYSKWKHKNKAHRNSSEENLIDKTRTFDYYEGDYSDSISF